MDKEKGVIVGKAQVDLIELSTTAPVVKKQNENEADSSEKAESTVGGETLTKKSAVNSTVEPEQAKSESDIELRGERVVLQKLSAESIDAKVEIERRVQQALPQRITLPVLVDVSKFDVVKEFEMTNELVSFIKYVPGACRDYDEGMVSLDTSEANIVSTSYSVFKPGTINVRYGLNKDKMPMCANILNDSVCLLKKGIVNLGGISSDNENLDYINGVIAIITTFMTNKKVLSMAKDNIVIMPSIPSNYQASVSPRFVTPVLPHLSLVSMTDNVEWVEKVYKTLSKKGLVNYKMGYAGGEDDPYNSTRSYVDYYVNVDQYAAQLYNLNLKFFRECDDAEGRLLKTVRAYADPRVDVDVETDARMSIITDYNSTLSLPTILLGAIMSADLGESILAANLDFYEHANLFRKLSNPKILSGSPRSGTDKLFSHIASRMQRCDFGMINRALAMETMPAFTVTRLINKPSPVHLESAIAILFEIFCFHLFTPDLFETVKGEVGNIILECASKIVAGDVEKFKMKFGYRYYTTNDRKEFQLSKEPWSNQTDYFADVHPSLFAGSFPGFTPESNIVVMIMSQFMPSGITYNCTRAQDAKFPRIDKSYTVYLPFEYSNRTDLNVFSTRIASFTETLRALVDKASSKGLHRGSPAVISLNEWFTHVVNRAEKLDTTVHSHLALLQQMRSEAYINVYKPFKGEYTDFKRVNYALLSGNNVFGKLYHLDKKYQDRCATIDMSYIWHIISGSTSVAMDRMGDNDTGIAAEFSKERIVLPNTVTCLMNDMKVLSQMRELSKAVGLISTLFSKRLFSDNEDMAWFRNLLNNLNLPTALFNLLVNLSIERVESKVTDYGRVNFSNHVSTQRTKLQDPVIKRIRSNNTIIDYDPDIDPEEFASELTFMTNIELERLLLGLKFVHKQPIQKVKLGVRIMRVESSLPFPSDKPDIPAGYTKIIANDNLKMFQAYDDLSGGNYSVTVGDETYSEVTTWPLVYLIINDRRVLSTKFKQNVLKGVFEAKWIVDIKDVPFIPKIVPSRVIDQNKQVVDILTVKNCDTIEVIEFTESALSRTVNTSRLVPVNTKFKMIYPLSTVITDYVVSGYGNVSFDDEPPLNFKIPDEFDFDSGTMRDGFELMYSFKSCAGVPKVDTCRVSMSNVVRTVSSNIEYADNLNVVIGKSPDLLILNNNVNDMYDDDI